jgi:cytochrome c peroxidase
MNRWNVAFKRPLSRLPCGGLLAGVLLMMLGLAGQPADSPRGKHGEASGEHQLRTLQGLIPRWDVARTPTGLDPVVWESFIPKDNPMTLERIDLGRKLYFDTRLSRDGTVSCATCHDVTRGFTDQRPV